MSKYQQLYENYLAKARSPFRGKKIAYETRIRMDRDDNIIITHHWTDILKFSKNGSITINTGGWSSRSTKTRINSYTPHHIRMFSNKGELLVSVNGIWYEYQRNMTIDRKGNVVEGKKAKMPKRQVQALLTGVLNLLDVSGDSHDL